MMFNRFKNNAIHYGFLLVCCFSLLGCDSQATSFHQNIVIANSSTSTFGATLPGPNFVGAKWVDSSGNFYIADTFNNVIRKVNTSGTISTIAGISDPLRHFGVQPSSVISDGSGNLYISSYFQVFKLNLSSKTLSVVAGLEDGNYSGDGGQATSAGFDGISAIALDSAGTHLYIADTYNNVIREVDLGTGIVSTVAGDYSCGYGSYSGDGASATSACLNSPVGIVVDGSGDIYIADSGNGVIREVVSGIINTVVGNNACANSFSGDGGAPLDACLYNPTGLALDGSGDLYISDTGNCEVREVSGGMINAAAGSGGNCGYSGDGSAAASAELYYPFFITLDGSGDLYIADAYNDAIREVSGGIIDRVAGTAQTIGDTGDGAVATSAELSYPQGVALDSSGNLYIADTQNSAVREVNAETQVISTLMSNSSAGYSGDGGQATSAQLNEPMSIVLDNAGHLYFVDSENNVVRKINLQSGIITTFAGNGTQGYTGDGGPATQAAMYPSGIALDSKGNLYIADPVSNVIRKVSSATGVITTIAGNGTTGFYGDGRAATVAELDYPSQVAVDGEDNLYIADYENSLVRKVTAATGIMSTVVGIPGHSGGSALGSAATSTEIRQPSDLSFDSAGNLYVITWSVVLKVDAQTKLTSLAAGGGSDNFIMNGVLAVNATLNDPAGIAIDSSGNLYIADTNDDVIRTVSAQSGLITTVAGNGSYSFSGDGGAATLAGLNSPY
jgi:sugar lactone lactonase YvrE